MSHQLADDQQWQERSQREKSGLSAICCCMVASKFSRPCPSECPSFVFGSRTSFHRFLHAPFSPYSRVFRSYVSYLPDWTVIKPNQWKPSFYSGYRVYELIKADYVQQNKLSFRSSFRILTTLEPLAHFVAFIIHVLWETCPGLMLNCPVMGFTLRQAQICPDLPNLSEMALSPRQPVMCVDSKALGSTLKYFTHCLSFISSH